MKTSRLIVLVFAVIVSACGSRARPVIARIAAPTVPPRLRATRFVAFGDSLTEGFAQRCPEMTAITNQVAQPFGLPLAEDGARSSPSAYPARLHAMLSERYPAQSITVINEGFGGDEREGGAADLPGVLTIDSPDVLLLQEGINTLNQRHADGIPAVVETLRRMIREGRSRGMTVFVGTLLPERPGGCRAYDLTDGQDDIIPANVEIRRMVGMENAVLVDLYQTFNGRTATLIGQDGLHPSEAGYRAIAETFFDAIKENLEDVD